MRPELPDLSHLSVRPDTSWHAQHSSQQAAISSRLGGCSQHDDAWQHDALHLANNPSASSGQRRGTVKKENFLSVQQELPVVAGVSLHESHLAAGRVVISKSMLEDLMADLAQSLADIAQLRQSVPAWTFHSPCKASPLLGPSHVDPPPAHPRSSDTDLPQHCDRQGLQHEDMHPSQPSVEKQSCSGASRKDGCSKQKSGDWQDSGPEGSHSPKA